MKLLDFIKQLGFGVLNNTNYGNVNTSKPAELLSLIVPIEEGLMRLYSRFVLRERHMVLEMRPGITFYHLTKLYSVQGGDRDRVPYPYIMDLPNDPFEEDVIKVLQVRDSNNNERPLNDPNRTDSVYTPQSDVLQNSFPRPLEALFLTYQARHVPLVTYISEGRYNIHDEIMLPSVLVPALSHYVAFLVFSRIGTPEALAKASTSMSLYEQVCVNVETMDLVDSSKSGVNTRFSQNGWT
ncbi:MAG: hypothetical protein ACK5LG_21910 [Bacteroides thetaiotaomicron]